MHFPPALTPLDTLSSPHLRSIKEWHIEEKILLTAAVWLFAALLKASRPIQNGDGIIFALSIHTPPS
jgi:hypothetical protein